MQRLVLARVVYGAKLFGLATEKSDDDFVSIVVPSARDILLNRNNEITRHGSTSGDNIANTPEDIDDKQVPFQVFVNGLKNSTLEYLEVLNAPLDAHQIEPHPLFLELRQNRVNLATKNVTKILGFCNSQAISYNPRIERLKAAQEVYDILVSKGVTVKTKERFATYIDSILDKCNQNLILDEIITDASGKNIRHLNVCGKRLAETIQASLALDIVSKTMQKYGSRVKQHAQTNSHDWKSLSHAIRIAQEGSEYVRTGQITLPVKNREMLLNIKLGLVPKSDVEAMVDQSIIDFERNIEISDLPLEADTEYLDDIIYRAHIGQVQEIFYNNFKLNTY